MIFDVNAFIGKWPYWPVPSANLRDWKIDRAAICSTRSVFVNWEDGNCEVERVVAENPEQHVGFACIGTRELSHTLPQGDYDFDSYGRRGFAGIRLYPQHHSYHPLYCSFVDRILEDAAARAWPVLLPHRIIMNWGMPMLDLTVIETLVERHSRVHWILAGINYLHELQLAIRLMRRHATVHLETSCVMGFEAIAKLVGECGAEQILFGSAAPIQHGGAGVEKILRARITDAAREAILCRNAARLLRLD